MPQDQIAEKLLVANLREGSEPAFRKLYDTYQKDIYAYSLSLLKSEAKAKDNLQDVFLKVWLNKEKLDPELSFKSFVFTITRNLAFNTLSKSASTRKLREAVFYKSQKMSSPADRQLMEAHYQELKQQAVDELSPRCKRVFEMSRNRGMTHQEISEELGVSRQTVKNQITSALSKIKEFLLLHGDMAFLLLFLAEISQ